MLLTVISYRILFHEAQHTLIFVDRIGCIILFYMGVLVYKQYMHIISFVDYFRMPYTSLKLSNKIRIFMHGTISENCRTKVSKTFEARVKSIHRNRTNMITESNIFNWTAGSKDLTNMPIRHGRRLNLRYLKKTIHTYFGQGGAIIPRINLPVVSSKFLGERGGPCAGCWRAGRRTSGSSPALAPAPARVHWNRNSVLKNIY